MFAGQSALVGQKPGVFQCNTKWPYLFFLSIDRESREHEDSIAPEITEELQPAKVPLLPKDIVNSKKVHALRKEQKRKLGKQRSIGSPMDYSPLPIDKHEPEFVRPNVENKRLK